MSVSIALAPGAEENGLASMLAELVRQNLDAKPHKLKDFYALRGSYAIVADDADVALTLRFAFGHLTVHDGIVSVPDVTIRATSDVVMALSNMPVGPFGLPIPENDMQRDVLKQAMSALRAKSFQIYGGFAHFAMLQRLTRVLSVNG
ncbi:MAG: hypothetical protein IPK71_21475 [Myxococcales bacterium]|jgi:hypothetical protein|nr:hypothetical protein [Myxococcales bacterium]MBL9111013.1 hypothetical protein [Myxococcales bacterium]